MVDQDFQALSVSLRNDREASYAFFNALDPRCLGPRYDNVVSILNLDVDRRQRNGSPKLVCFHPKLLLVDHNVLSSAAGWLSSMLGWHREVLRHNIATLTDYDILTRNTSEFDTVVDHLMLEMNMSVHEVSCLLRCVPSLLLLEVNAINALASRYPSSFQLAAALLQQEGNPTGGWVTSVGVLRANPRLGQLNTLYLLSKGVSPEEIERLVTEKPTLLRRPLWENEDKLL